jgi:hypothetical protein
VRRPCLACRKVFVVPKGKKGVSRCPECTTQHGRDKWAEKMSDPLERELRKLRRSAKWRIARDKALKRDGHKCRGIVRGDPCGSTDRLDVHHRVLARDLIYAGHDPCDLQYLVSLCRRCHGLADAQLRQRGWGLDS